MEHLGRRRSHRPYKTRRRSNPSSTSSSNTSSSSWFLCRRNPCLVFLVSFVSLGSLRFRQRTQRLHRTGVASSWSSVRRSTQAVGSMTTPVSFSASFDQALLGKINHHVENIPNVTTETSLPSLQGIQYSLVEQGQLPNSRRHFQRFQVIRSASSSVSSSEVSTTSQKSADVAVPVDLRQWMTWLAQSKSGSASGPEDGEAQNVVMDLLIQTLVEAPYAAYFWELPGIIMTSTDGTTKDPPGLWDSRPAEFVLVDAPDLQAFCQAQGPQPQTFARHFPPPGHDETEVVDFFNLGKDALLIVPTPPSISSPLDTTSDDRQNPEPNTPPVNDSSLAARSSITHAREAWSLPANPLSSYCHVASFVRQAPRRQIRQVLALAATRWLELWQQITQATPPLALQDQMQASSSTTTTSHNSATTSLWAPSSSSARAGEPPKALFMSTSGMGVSWLHIRLDRYPKYYQYHPYRDELLSRVESDVYRPARSG